MIRYVLTLLLGTSLVSGRPQVQHQAEAPQVPDWALPGSPTHKQIAPPEDFHRLSRTDHSPLGIFEGQSDVGGPLVPGASSYDTSTGRYTVRSAGYNIWYNRDEFRFVWKEMRGDLSLAADASFPDTQGYDDRKAVLVIRQSLDDNSAEVVVGEHGTGMIHIAERDTTNATMTDAAFRFGGTLTGVKARRIGIEKRGDQFTLFISLKDEPLHQFGPPIQVKLHSPFYVGIGFCSHQPATPDTAVFSNVVLMKQAGQVH